MIDIFLTHSLSGGMNSQLNILLIQPPSPRTSNAPHLGLAYLASSLKSVGANVEVIDDTAPYTRYGYTEIQRIARRGGYDFIGITITTLFAVFAYELIKRLKADGNTIITGGPHATLFPEESLDQGASIAVRGEAEHTIREIAEHFKGDMALEEIKGISFVTPDGKVCNTPERSPEENLDLFPFPAKEAFRYDDFIQMPRDLNKFGSLLASRGCPAKCTFCSQAVFGRRIRYRSHENIIEEIRSLHAEFGINTFSFLDDTLTAKRSWVSALCAKIKEQIDFPISWSCVTRINFVDADMLSLMQSAGCCHINYGIESANPQTLKRIKKNINLKKVEEVLYNTVNTNIECSVNFMFGFPWERVEDIRNTHSFMKRISRYVSNIDPAGILIPFPGTQVFEEFKDKHDFDKWWLHNDRFTGNYRKSLNTPVFRYFYFLDFGLLDESGFFVYSREVKREIGRAMNFIGKHNLGKHHPIYRFVALFFIHLSQSLYRLNPKIEEPLATLFYFLLHIKNRAKTRRKR